MDRHAWIWGLVAVALVGVTVYFVLHTLFAAINSALPF